MNDYYETVHSHVVDNQQTEGAKERYKFYFQTFPVILAAFLSIKLQVFEITIRL